MHHASAQTMCLASLPRLCMQPTGVRSLSQAMLDSGPLERGRHTCCTVRKTTVWCTTPTVSRTCTKPEGSPNACSPRYTAMPGTRLMEFPECSETSNAIGDETLPLASTSRLPLLQPTRCQPKHAASRVDLQAPCSSSEACRVASAYGRAGHHHAFVMLFSLVLCPLCFCVVFLTGEYNRNRIA